MSQGEVRQILGPPQQVASIEEADGTYDAWRYVGEGGTNYQVLLGRTEPSFSS